MVKVDWVVTATDGEPVFAELVSPGPDTVQLVAPVPSHETVTGVPERTREGRAVMVTAVGSLSTVTVA